MRKKYIMAFCHVAAFPANAQETYENANIVTGDLNGTARYVGMGGAMDALGAEISTISTNPAGLGLFRSSQISATGGFTMQQDAKDLFRPGGFRLGIEKKRFVVLQLRVQLP